MKSFRKWWFQIWVRNSTLLLSSMILTIRMPTFGTRRVAWSQKWNNLNKNIGSFENISRTKLFGTNVHYKREVETWYSTRFTVLIDFFAKQNSRRFGFFFLLLLTRLWDFEKNADQCHMWCDHFLSAINQFWWALFHYGLKKVS